MSTILNDRDVLLQAASPREFTSLSRALVIAADAPLFKVTSGTPAPTTIGIVAKPLNIPGNVTFSVSGATSLAVSGNNATLSYANVVTFPVTVTAQIVYSGVTYTASTVINRVLDGTNGANGSAGSSGSNGQRGTINIASNAYGGTWSDANAFAAVSAAGYGSPINRDIVTLYSSSASTSKYYQSGSWFTLDAYVNGNMLVSGTLSANQVFGGTLDGVVIKAGGFGISPSSRVFEVQSSGFCYATFLNAGNTSVTNSPVPVSPALQVTAVSGSSGPAGQFSNAGVDVCILAASSNNAGGSHALRGRNTATGSSGLVGPANSYDFLANGTGLYGPFTGGHDVLIPNGVDPALGDIVVDVRCVARQGLSNTIFEAAASSAPCQANVVGILVRKTGPLADHQPPAFYGDLVIPTFDHSMSPEYDLHKDDYQLFVVNALGEGQMNVCGENGDIAAGEYIVTSSTPGKGMRQSDDALRNYTVAKARESVVFSSPSEIKQIACFYVCG